MSALINVFCVIGLVGCVVFGAALVYAIASTRPVNVQKIARKYLEK